METNIIKEELIKRSKKISEEKKRQSGAKLLFFEKRIGDVDSISILPNRNGSMTPVLWESLRGDVILEIMRSLSKNKFYYYKEIKGERQKLRLKKVR